MVGKASLNQHDYLDDAGEVLTLSTKVSPPSIGVVPLALMPFLTPSITNTSPTLSYMFPNPPPFCRYVPSPVQCANPRLFFPAKSLLSPAGSHCHDLKMGDSAV